MIAWEIKITPVSIGAGKVTLVGVGTDDEGIPNPISVRVEKVPYKTEQERHDALDLLNRRYLAKLARQTTIETWLAGKEADAITYLREL